MPVTGWKLDRDQRAALLKRLPPVWPDTIADHITLKSHAPAEEPLPSATEAEIVGSADDDQGLQAMVVAIDGTTVRPTAALITSPRRSIVAAVARRSRVTT